MKEKREGGGGGGGGGEVTKFQIDKHTKSPKSTLRELPTLPPSLLLFHPPSLPPSLSPTYWVNREDLCPDEDQDGLQLS